MVNRSSLGETLDRGRMHFNLETAVAKYLGQPGNYAATEAQRTGHS